MSKRRLAMVATMAMVVGALLLIPGTSQGVGKKKMVKATSHETFSPDVVRIKKGKEVRFKSVKGNPDHSVVAYEGDWVINQSLHEGDYFDRQFTKVGVYKYHCIFHSKLVDGKCEGMCGVVKVKPRN